ncbi:3-oxoacyl-ACP synthase [Winogradskyella sp. UBA3174]|uniref:3-oxoacyl-ACP synthase n=1 Tax=Winogradskyella sp. UBA3174 TaxID=1947785 RepID=UPI0026009F1E|nr:3-oxoacyl-ACP synthase [Winogradskyella sp. UBA3174]|tara:strand:+ start:1454 stop:1903 length:450 start_codon:yes stop_codon:yes gene_type:complete
MSIKQKLHGKCQDFLNNRLEVIQHTILDIQNSLESETKSSAGDKHETGRAMLQLEREKAGHQLAELQKINETLHKIEVKSKHSNVALGSLVITSNRNYFIAISAGELTLEGVNYYAISTLTPIAQLLLSKQVGDTVQFRDTKFTVTEIQ